MAKKKTFTTKQVLAFHWKQAMQFRGLVATSFIVAPITIIIERYVTPLIIAALLLNIQNGTVTLDSSWWMIIVYALLLILTNIIGYRVNLYASWGVQVKGAQKIYQESYERLTKQSLNFYSDNFAGSLVSRVNRFASAYISFWNMVIFDILFVTVTIVATIIGTAIFMWQYAIVITVLVALFIIASYFGTRFMRPRQKARSKAYTEISAKLSDSISNIFAVKIDSRERYEQDRLRKSIDDMTAKEFHVRRGMLTISSVYSTIITIMRVAVLLICIVAVEYGVANTAIVYIVLTYTFNLIDEMRSITNTFRSLYQITGDSEEMLETLAEPLAVEDKSTTTLRVKKGAVSISNMSFTHQDGLSPLFTDLSLDIPAGQKIGIVGVSGSGKTTLTKLLLRFNDPNSGTITIDNTDISTVTQASLHDAIAYVPQEPLLFHRSIAENISYSSPGATEKAIVNAAKKAHADTFIRELTDTYSTLVGERGVKLSGGQRQRIAIARAILKDAPILVLDEATSALDSESEKLIQASLETLMKGRTSIVIAHRLSTIAKLDRIIVLSDGKITEDGTHDKLLAMKGDYAKLWKHQSGGFIED